MRHRVGALAPALVVLGLLSACGQQQASIESATSLPPQRVREVFNVGDTVVVRSLAVEVAANTLWVGTSVGLLEIDLASMEPVNTFTREHGLANEYIFGIGIDSKGYKWFGTNAGGVSRYKDGQWQVYFPMHGLADYWVYCFAEQSGGRFWIGTWAGANLVDLETLDFSTYKAQLINEWVYGLAVDSRDRVWFGTEGGITMHDGKQWRHWTHADGLGGANSAGLPISANTGLGTRERHDLSISVGAEESYNPSYVFAVMADDRDRIWAGTWGGGVSLFDGDAWTSYTVQDGLAGNVVYSMIQDAEGVYWFGTNGGLSRFDGNSWVTYGHGEGLLGTDVYAIVEAPGGAIWVGTQNGVSMLSRPDHAEGEAKP